MKKDIESWYFEISIYLCSIWKRRIIKVGILNAFSSQIWKKDIEIRYFKCLPWPLCQLFCLFLNFTENERFCIFVSTMALKSDLSGLSNWSILKWKIKWYIILTYWFSKKIYIKYNHGFVKFAKKKPEQPKNDFIGWLFVGSQSVTKKFRAFIFSSSWLQTGAGKLLLDNFFPA